MFSAVTFQKMMEWNGMEGMEWNEMEWNGMEWKRNGMDRTGPVVLGAYISHFSQGNFNNYEDVFGFWSDKDVIYRNRTCEYCGRCTFRIEKTKKGFPMRKSSNHPTKILQKEFYKKQYSQVLISNF